jgi:hypothetical protein
MTKYEKYIKFIIEDLKDGVTYKFPHHYIHDVNVGVYLHHHPSGPYFGWMPSSFKEMLIKRYGVGEKEVDYIWSIISEHMIKVYLKSKDRLSEDFTYGDSVNRELNSRIEKDREERLDNSKTIPSKGIVSPSSIVINNVCKREKFCNAQGKITFGQLAGLIKSAKSKKIRNEVGEGVYKSLIRLLPWFIPQIAIASFFGSGLRAANKIIKPALETTTGYKSWWGKTIMNLLSYAEGELPITDPLSKIFFISDGLLELMGEKHKVKFARYIAELASSKNDNEVVPEYFVENELRDWINQKFLIDPPLKPKN